MSVEQFGNNYTTTLTDSMTAGQLTLPCASAAPLPLRSGQFRVIADSEIILVTASSSTPWTVARAQEGTAAASHGSGTTVTHVLTAASVLNTTSFDPRAYGNKSTTDDSTTLNACLVDMAVAGGTMTMTPETWYWPTVTIPTFTSTVVRQRPMRIVGAGSSHNFVYAASGGTIIQLSGGTNAHIEALGHGPFGLAHLTLQDITGSTTPFILDTNATMRLYDVTFRGSKSGTACDQDAVIFGGTGATDDGTASSPFSGYGGSLTFCEFQGIRRTAYIRRFGNGITYGHNTIGPNCGSNLADGGYIEVDGIDPANDAHSINIVYNTAEVGNYPYPIKLANCHAVHAIGNGYHDATATTLAYHRLEATATGTLIIPGSAISTTPMVSDASGGRYTVIMSGSYGDIQASRFPGGLSTLTKAGVPVDGDWSVAPPIGTMVYDTTNHKFWVREAAATWKGVVLA